MPSSFNTVEKNFWNGLRKAYGLDGSKDNKNSVRELRTALYEIGNKNPELMNLKDDNGRTLATAAVLNKNFKMFEDLIYGDSNEASTDPFLADHNGISAVGYFLKDYYGSEKSQVKKEMDSYTEKESYDKIYNKLKKYAEGNSDKKKAFQYAETRAKQYANSLQQAKTEEESLFGSYEKASQLRVKADGFYLNQKVFSPNNKKEIDQKSVADKSASPNPSQLQSRTVTSEKTSNAFTSQYNSTEAREYLALSQQDRNLIRADIAARKHHMEAIKQNMGEEALKTSRSALLEAKQNAANIYTDRSKLSEKTVASIETYFNKRLDQLYGEGSAKTIAYAMNEKPVQKAEAAQNKTALNTTLNKQDLLKTGISFSYPAKDSSALDGGSLRPGVNFSLKTENPLNPIRSQSIASKLDIQGLLQLKGVQPALSQNPQPQHIGG